MSVEKLVEALRFYANPEIYKPHPHGPAFDRRDLSHHAIAALAAHESERTGRQPIETAPKDGGPAFPVPQEFTPGGVSRCGVSPGMTLRDYFAAKAMQGFAAKGEYQNAMLGAPNGRSIIQWIAECSYDYADAMLAAREQAP